MAQSWPPKRATTLTIYFAIRDADGDPVTAVATPDSEISKDGGAFADCTNEVTELATASGVYSLILTATEMTADVVVVQTKTATAGAKTAVNVIYTAESTWDEGIDVKAVLAGAIIAASHAAGAIDAAAIADGAIDAATLATGTITAAKFAAGAIDAAAIADGAIDAATLAAGTITASKFAAGAIDAAAIAVDAIGSSELAADAVTEIQSGLATAAALATVQADTDNIQTRLPTVLVGGRMDSDVAAIQAGVITAATIAPDAIGASELAADAVLEIADGVWDELTAGHLVVGSAGLAVQGDLSYGTAQGGAAGTITLAASDSSIDNFYIGMIIRIQSGTGSGQARMITDYVGSTRVATVSPNWVTAPVSLSSIYVISAIGPSDVRSWRGSVPNVLISNRVDASVGAMAADVLTAAAIATDAIGSAELAASAVTEIQVGLATSAALASVATGVSDIQGRIPAALVGGRIDASVGAMAANVLTAAALATDAGTELADALLTRDMSAVTGEAARSPLNALRFLRNKWTISGATLTVRKEDDAASAWTAAITQTAGNPVSEIDPA